MGEEKHKGSKSVNRSITTEHGRIEETFVRCGKVGCWCSSAEGRARKGRYGHGPYYYEVRSYLTKDGERKEVRQYQGSDITQLRPWRHRKGSRKEDPRSAKFVKQEVIKDET